MSDPVEQYLPPLICVFDPDHDFLELMERFAQNRKDIRLKTFVYSRHSVPDFEKIVYDFFPDILVVNLDQEEPEKFGELIFAIRSFPIPLHPIILGTTSKDSPDQKYRAYRMGVDDYLIRPFSIQDIGFRMDACIRIRGMQRQLDGATRTLGRLNVQLAASNARLEELTVTDDLTGLYNMRHMTQYLDNHFQILQRHARPFSVMMLDLDKFKQVNDKHDHMVGSATICAAGKVIDYIFRKSDMKARYGGDEFIVALPETDVKGATLVCERLRVAIEKTPMRGSDDEEFFVTASIGVCTYDPARHKSFSDIVKEADKAMYQAKSLGRNRVVVSEGSQVDGYDESQSTVLSAIRKIDKKSVG